MRKKIMAVCLAASLVSTLTGCQDLNYIEPDTKIATQAHSFRCGLVAQQYKLFNKLNYIFNFTMEIFTYAI